MLAWRVVLSCLHTISVPSSAFCGGQEAATSCNALLHAMTSKWERRSKTLFPARPHFSSYVIS